MPRKGENIYKRKDGRWEGRYVKGHDSEGRMVYGSVYGRKYHDVRRQLVPLREAYNAKKETRVHFSGTVKEWLMYWLEEWKRPHVRPSTYSGYRGKVERHVFPVLGEKKLEKLKEAEVQEWLDGLLDKGMAPSSVKVIFRILHDAVQKATQKHCLLLNPCQNVVLPGRDQTGIKALTLMQQKQLEKAALKTKGNEAVLITLYTGMRIGEISALRWVDIDFEQNRIMVRSTLQRIPDYDDGGTKTRIIAELPKSDTSRRIIPFSDNLRTHLQQWNAKSKSEYVVSCKDHHAEPRVLSYRYKKAAAIAGVLDFTFHSLRHTYATRCIEQGIDIATISRLLGHASIKMTLDTYADSTMERRESAMRVLDRLLPTDSSQIEDTMSAIADQEKLAQVLLATMRKEMFSVG